MEANRSEKSTQFRKVPISKEAEEALQRMVTETNQGFSGGRVGKAEVLSWLVLHFEKSSFTGAKEDIRKAHFDKVAYLAAVLEKVKRAQRNGHPVPDLDALLAPLAADRVD